MSLASMLAAPRREVTSNENLRSIDADDVLVGLRRRVDLGRAAVLVSDIGSARGILGFVGSASRLGTASTNNGPRSSAFGARDRYMGAARHSKAVSSPEFLAGRSGMAQAISAVQGERI